MSRVRVHNFSISLDGFGTGEGHVVEAPFGHAGHRLHEWMVATRFWRVDAAGTVGVDNAFAERHEHGIGAEIMGAGKFGPAGWQDAPGVARMVGDNPPFHTPTFVLTHHPRPPLEMDGGTTFHFLDAAPADALGAAREAADGQDVRIGGGPTMLREFLAAGLVDHLHVVQVPILLGRGVRLWDGSGGAGGAVRRGGGVVAERRHPSHLHPMRVGSGGVGCRRVPAWSHPPLPCATGASSPAPAPPISSRARPGRTPRIESFNAGLRDAVLDSELFSSLAEAKLILAEWLEGYNSSHPYSSLGMLPPACLAAAWRPEAGLGQAA